MNTKAITKSAIMIALATVLSLITVLKMPQGGSVTAASMVPIIFIALTSTTSVSIVSALAYAAVQMLIGFYPPPVQSFGNFMLVILLDYVIAFGVLGCAGLIAKPFKNKLVGGVAATVVVCVVRFICHFLSGITVWATYAGEMNATIYSATYNGTYMGVEALISVVAIIFLIKGLSKTKNGLQV